MSYNEASNINPKSSLARGKKTVAPGTPEKYEDALHSAEEALEAGSNDAYTWYQKGAALNNLNRYERAVACFEKALEIQPDLAVARYNKGSALAALGKNEESIK